MTSASVVGWGDNFSFLIEGLLVADVFWVLGGGDSEPGSSDRTDQLGRARRSSMLALGKAQMGWEMR